MATKTKAKKRQVKVKKLEGAQKKLTAQDLKKVKGGHKFAPLVPGTGKIAMATDKK
jgi:hypothetical protein